MPKVTLMILMILIVILLKLLYQGRGMITRKRASLDLHELTVTDKLITTEKLTTTDEKSKNQKRKVIAGKIGDRSLRL